MNSINKYFMVFIKMKIAKLIADLGFRMNFVAGIVGSVCFVLLYIITIVILMPKISFLNWTIKEMWVLLGTFIVFCYSVFYLFWKGMMDLVEGIRTGSLDFYLLKPIDSQFYISFCEGGGIHNLMLMIFGFLFTCWAVFSLGLSPTVFQWLMWIITVFIAIMDFYSVLFLLGMLNFHFGYLGEAVFQIFDLQGISRYPMEAFSKLPIGVAILAIPFSALTTVPTKILINMQISWIEIGIYIFVSIVFIFGVRLMWFKELDRYSSASS